MLTLYRHRKSESSEDSDNGKKIIPAGRAYLTKVNGKLVMARGKRDRPAENAIDLLGEAFGIQTRITRKRAKSLEEPKAPLMIAGAPYHSQHQFKYPSYTSPIPQVPFQPHMIQPPVMSQQIFPSNMMQMPVYPQSQRYTIGHGNPTERDFEQLKEIDAHYRHINAENKNRLSPGQVEDGSRREETTSKTTIPITKHVCANCGRLRSRKYYHENPMKPGEIPTATFCRRCQKDTSSASDSDGSQSPKNKNKKKKVRQKQQKKPNEKDNEGKSTGLLAYKEPPKPQPKNVRIATKETKRAQSEKYIVVEEDYSEEEPEARGRTSLRIEESDIGRHPLSPLSSRYTPRRAQSSNYFEQNSTPTGIPAKKIIIEERFHERSPSPYDQYVPAPAQAPPSRSEKIQGRQEPSHYLERNLYEPGYSSRISANSHIPALRPSMVSRENSFDTASSWRSQESRRRRHVERSNPDNATSRPWENPHVIHPRNGETVVVTERYVYRPRIQSHSEEGRRQQEYADMAAFDIRSRTEESTIDMEAPSYHNDIRSHQARSTTEEEASRYYQDDWSRNEPTHIRGKLPRRRAHIPGRYRRDASPNSSFAESESTEYVKTYAPPSQRFPRAPTPPSPSQESTRTKDRLDALAYPLSSDEEVELPLRVGRKDNANHGISSGRPVKQRSGSITSGYRPPFVREETDGVTDKALILSPHHPRSSAPSYENFSDMTEREQIAETQTKRVKFHEQDSLLSSNYSSVSERSVSSVGEMGDYAGASAGAGVLRWIDDDL